MAKLKRKSKDIQKSRFKRVRTAKQLAYIHPLPKAPTTVLNVYICGEGESGELGLGAFTRNGKKPYGVTRPRFHDLLEPFQPVQVAAGGMHAVALCKDGCLVTWGVNDDGALGRNTSPRRANANKRSTGHTKSTEMNRSPNSVSSEEVELNETEATPRQVSKRFIQGDVVKIVATDSACFALTTEGKVYGWGTFKGNDGTLGFSADDSKAGRLIQRVPAIVSGLENIVELATGTNHVLALDRFGTVWSWGCGSQSQLGTRSHSSRSRQMDSKFDDLIPKQIHFWRGRKQIKTRSIGAGHYCSFSIDLEGQVWGWGLNNYAQVGLGRSGGTVNTPTLLRPLKNFDIHAIEGGEHHTIACTALDQIVVWGRCDDSQAGIPLDTVPEEHLVHDSRETPIALVEPTAVPGISSHIAAAGIDHSIVINPKGEAYSWGFSSNYRTGLGTEDTITEPTPIGNSAIKNQKLVFAACGGQFLILASNRSNKQ